MHLHLDGHRLVAMALLLALPGLALAHDGHDHGDSAPAATAAALPRFTAESESFELVGVLDGRRLTLYLDRFADNSPVRDARLELQLGDEKLVPAPHGEGEFEVLLAAAPVPGMLPVTATVTAGTETDLLAGDFDLHAPQAEAAAAPPAWRRAAGWLAAAAAAVLLVLAGLRTARARRGVNQGGAA